MENQDNQANKFQFLRFPFLGAREDGEAFSYLLMDIRQDQACIAISKWLVNRTILSPKEKVDLFIPSLLAIEYDFRNHSSGQIISIRQDSTTQEFFYDISFTHPLSIHFSENWSLAEFTEHLPTPAPVLQMLLKLVKDSLILKQGILVYLKHLTPYFSRVVNYAVKDYGNVNKIIFGDVENKIREKEKVLEELYYLIQNNIKTIHDIAIFINLEDLREVIESEIPLDLCLIAFSEVASRDELLKLLNKPAEYIEYASNKYMTYLLAIKDLEKRLYSNYNQIVLIYLKSVLAH